MDMAQVLEKVEPLTKLKGEVIEGDFKVLWSADDGAVELRPGRGKRAIPFNPDSLERLFNHANINKNLRERISTQTLMQAVSESLANAQQDKGLSILTRDGMIEDIGPGQEFRSIPPERVLRKITKGLGGEVDFSRVLTLPNHTIRVETLGMEQKAVVENDIIRAGTMTQFSPLGITIPAVQSFNLRQWCLNGATTMDIVRDFQYGGEGDDIWQFFQRANREAYRSIGPVIERYQQLMQEEVTPEDRAAVVNALLKQMKASTETVAAVQARALETPPQNSYDVLQLATWATSHVIADPVRIVRAQNAIATWTNEETHARTCPTCNTGLRRN